MQVTQNVDSFTGALPQMVSPVRHGSKAKCLTLEFLVRMFDGNMSETKDEQERRLAR